MTTDTDTDTDIDTIEEEETDEFELSDQAKLAFEAIDMLCRELQGKVDIDTLSDALMSIGFDMTRHIAEHAMPGSTNAEKSDAVREHLESIIGGLIKNVWSDLPES